MSENNITQNGIVVTIKEKVLFISINCDSPCSACHAKGACTSQDSAEKIVEVTVLNPQEFRIGEKVRVIMPLKMGFLALFYGILLPFITIIVALSIGNRILLNDIKSGFLALTMLAGYYVFLYFNQARWKREFVFKVEKIDQNY